MKLFAPDFNQSNMTVLKRSLNFETYKPMKLTKNTFLTNQKLRFQLDLLSVKNFSAMSFGLGEQHIWKIQKMVHVIFAT